MKVAVYRLQKKRGSSYFSLAMELDYAYWEEHQIEIRDVRTYASFGQALVSESHLTTSVDFISAQSFTHSSIWDVWRPSALRLWQRAQGRSLLWHELSSLLTYYQCTEEQKQMRKVVQALYCAGKVEVLPAITLYSQVRGMCNRCFHDGKELQQVYCASCKKDCLMCRACLHMGKSISCQLLLRFPTGKVEERWESGQPANKVWIEVGQSQWGSVERAGAEQCRQFIAATQTKLLVWTVAGNHNIKLLAPAMREVVGSGGRVLWLSSYRGNVEGIAAELAQYFPQTRVVHLVGERSQVWEQGEIMVATVAQLLRFCQFFTLVIMDERESVGLEEVALRERKMDRVTRPGGKQVILSLTPAPYWQARVQQGKMASLIIPVRHHQHPLAVPRISRKHGLWEHMRAGRKVAGISRFLERVRATEGQALILVPRISAAYNLRKWMMRRMDVNEDELGIVVTSHLEEDIEVEHFREGKRRILLTTRLLGRAITLPKVHVLVVGADDPQYDWCTLVHAAEHVGHSSSYRQGEVCFIVAEHSWQVRRARNTINSLNRLAQKRGVISSL
ncbi:hypothetical protein [Mechercharimyces sp. CAU 1602]|uniref:hypothetical protein n=1 Tax=Mechercharimyces sp. CAU 1602 TaxID=2973933 RepID=UPI0021633834|nr:hypothetical protein [Mechercharimyces sp. CAU 1602]MCS1352237.1 hypothetical protein [Mechercharimyces sp. CAU 1602]